MGPACVDCSGPTSPAWQRAGRPVTRTSREQWAELPHVPPNRLRPGDPVVHFPEATQVAMYLGNGRVAQAPRRGATTKVCPIAADPVLGAVHPDPTAGSRAPPRPRSSSGAPRTAPTPAVRPRALRPPRGSPPGRRCATAVSGRVAPPHPGRHG
ncbi:NlpC/P60 family protein [Streptomyces sp. NPDC057746]|uniref:NlpC/P60 family protein n=1 Tax=Streptomyces sp. NPDC057746 TaxID=3346237 RepID=UPI00369DF046